MGRPYAGDLRSAQGFLRPCSTVDVFTDKPAPLSALGLNTAPGLIAVIWITWHALNSELQSIGHLIQVASLNVVNEGSCWFLTAWGFNASTLQFSCRLGVGLCL